MPSQTTLLGAAGEHLVMSELLRRGYIAALAPVGVPNADIIVTDINGQRQCSVQVKTRRDIGSDGGWHMRPKHEGLRSERLFYCFVDMGRSSEATPKLYVIPAAIVAEAIYLSHRTWLSSPGAKGQQRKDSDTRRFMPDYSRVFGDDGNPYPAGWLEPYRNAWSLMGLPTTVVEVEAE